MAEQIHERINIEDASPTMRATIMLTERYQRHFQELLIKDMDSGIPVVAITAAMNAASGYLLFLLAGNMNILFAEQGLSMEQWIERVTHTAKANALQRHLDQQTKN